MKSQHLHQSLISVVLVVLVVLTLLLNSYSHSGFPPLAAVHFRVHVQILLFVFKSLNGLALPYLSELLRPYAPKLWNVLPLHIRQAPSLPISKTHLKT